MLLAGCGGGSDPPPIASVRIPAGAQPLTYLASVGTSEADTIAGGSDRTNTWGLDGNDSIAAGVAGGNLHGDSGDDLLVGKQGPDRLIGGRGNDRIFGGPANDMLMGNEGDDFLDEGAGHGDIDGGPGNDTLIGGPGADAFAISPDSGHDVIRDFTAGPGMFDHLAVERLRWQDLTIEDGATGVLIRWATGSVLLEGVRKAELAQDDFMFAESPDLPPASRAPSGPASERPTPANEGPVFSDGGAASSLQPPSSFSGDKPYQLRVGTSADDVMEGTAAWDHSIGGDGNDALGGGDADDILEGNAGNDTLSGGPGRDKLDGGPGNDRLDGGVENDELMGGDGNDVIDAGAGHDMIEGGIGDDTLTGGPGADAFIVRPDSGHDVVTDFEATGAAQGAFDHVAFIDIMPQHVSVTDTAEGALIRWDTNGDGAADGSVLLRGVTRASLRQTDFTFNARPGFVQGIETQGSYYVFANE